MLNEKEINQVYDLIAKLLTKIVDRLDAIELKEWLANHPGIKLEGNLITLTRGVSKITGCPLFTYRGPFPGSAVYEDTFLVKDGYTCISVDENGCNVQPVIQLKWSDWS